MTQLQTRETTQTPSEPVSPQEQGSKWTAFVVGGVLALLAAAFGLALWANSNAEPETTTDFGASSDSVEIVQNEIDKAVAATGAETSSVEIVQDEIDKALAEAQAEPSSVAIVQSEIDRAIAEAQAEFSSVEIVQNEIDKAVAGSEAEQRAAAEDAAAFGEESPSVTPDRAAQWVPYWPLEAEKNQALAEAQAEPSSVEIVQNEIDKALAQAETELSPSEIEQAVESRQVRFSEDSVDPVANYGSEGGLDAASFGGE